MDISFDGIANKFDKNIYGTVKGQLRHLLLTDLLSTYLASSEPLSILDLGAGTGIMSKECLKWGHSVDVLDVSNDVLVVAKSVLSEFDKVRFINQSFQNFNPDKQYDFVLCHAVLEWLANPLDQLTHIIKFLKPKGCLSISAFNKDALRFGNMVYGNFDYVEKGMKVKKQVKLNPKNPIYPNELIDALVLNKMQIIQKTGIRCFADYVKRELSDDDYPSLVKLEKRFNQQEPYLWLGKYFHVFATFSGD